MKKNICLSVILLLLANISFADPVKPTLPNGTTEWGTSDVLKASDLNNMFNALYNWANGNITSDNLSSTGGIAQTPEIRYSTTLSTDTTTVSVAGALVLSSSLNTFVTIDGILQIPSTDYTIASTSVTFDESVPTGSVIQIYKLD